MGANVLRVLLVVLAAIQIGQAADLFTYAGHSQAELAAWHAAAAVGLLTGAARPRLIDALMPVMAGAAGVTVVVSVRGLVADRTSAGEEAAHLFLVLGFLVLTLLWTVHGGAKTTPEPADEEWRTWDPAGEARPPAVRGVPR
ncbi:MAG: hypothetical protein ACT4QG_23010 [Sporichthyaceae bacterium]